MSRTTPPRTHEAVAVSCRNGFRASCSCGFTGPVRSRTQDGVRPYFRACNDAAAHALGQLQ